MPVRQITDFFKKYTVPKDRVPDNRTIEEEIIVASPRLQQASRRDVANSRESRQTASASSAAKHRSARNAPQLSRQSSTLSTMTSMSTNSPRRSQKMSHVPSGQSPPTKRTRTPKRSPQKRCLIPSLDDGGDDDELYHSSPTPSTQRPMISVDIPSPKPRVTPTPTPQPERPISKQQTTSFSSFSTLSSAPKSSQSSSRRVIKHGLQAVTNSDSGSDSDSEGLAELDSFMPRKKVKMTPPGKDANHAMEIPDTLKPARQSARLSDKGSAKGGRATPQLLPSPPKTTKVYKHSLASMAKQHQKKTKQDARIAEAEAAVAAAEKRKEEQAVAARLLDGKKMAETMAEDSDEGARMIQAMARTEALQDEERFYFFKDASPAGKNDLFPTSSLPNDSWVRALQNDQARAQACLSGFVADLAAMGLLNTKVTSWFGWQLLYEPREELCEAYVEIIRASAEHKQTVDSAKLSSMKGFFTTSTYPRDEAETAVECVQMTGTQRSSQGDVIKCVCEHTNDDGSTVLCDSCNTWQHTTCYRPQYDGREMAENLEHQCVDCKPRKLDVGAAQKRLKKILKQQQRAASSQSSEPRKPETASGLRFFVRVMQCCAPVAGIEGISRALCDLALANIDEHVKENASLRFSIQDAIEILSGGIAANDIDAVYEQIRKDIFDNDKLSPGLQCRLIASLPATSINTHHLRRRLALYLITKSTKHLPLSSDDWHHTIIKRLRKAPKFSTSDSANYALLTSLTEVLDIALDAGFSDYAFLAQPKPPAKPVGPFGKSAGPSPEEQAFNNQIDALTKQLRLMHSKIKDAGATHLRRMEAKSALDRVAVRLEHSVRTRPKPRKNVFGGGDLAESKGFMEGFAKKVEKPVLSSNGNDQSESKIHEHMDGHADSKTGGDEKDEVELVTVDTLSDRHMSDDEDAVGGAEVREDASSPPISESAWNLSGAVRL